MTPPPTILLFLLAWLTPCQARLGFSGRHTPKLTTMEKLEAHVWRTQGDINGNFACSIVRQDTVFTRAYHSQSDQWSGISCSPFYLYNPKQRKDIIFTDFNEPIPFFNPQRMGKRQNSRYIIMRQHLYDEPGWIITVVFDILALTDTTLTLQYTDKIDINKGEFINYYHATDMPFPWDSQAVQQVHDVDFKLPISRQDIRKEKRRVRRETRIADKRK